MNDPQLECFDACVLQKKGVVMYHIENCNLVLKAVKKSIYNNKMLIY